MIGFIEVTSLSTGRKVTLNLSSVISISKTDSGLADIHTDHTIFTTYETYDSLMKDIKRSRGAWLNGN
jgi:hypothetical protein